jgi:hypothetical protein
MARKDGVSDYRTGWLWRKWDAWAKRADRRDGWHWYSLPIALAILLGIRNNLRRENLVDTSKDREERPAGEFEERYLTQRSIDGSHNDLRQPEMGMAGRRFGRNVCSKAAWPEEEPRIKTPNPLVISERLLVRKEFIPAESINNLAAAWIQFMVRDWMSHEPGDSKCLWELDKTRGELGTVPRIPRADPMPADRSQGRPPAFRNEVTPWWDASQIYGVNADDEQLVRSYEGGQLKEFGPEDVKHALALRKGRIPILEPGFWLGLGMLHRLFTLEHNRICRELKTRKPKWGDEELFQCGRLINAALIAKIHTVEWTPAMLNRSTTRWSLAASWYGLLGRPIPLALRRLVRSEELFGILSTKVDHFGVPYSLTEEFSAVYRMHPLIADRWVVRSAADDHVRKRYDFAEIAGPGAVKVLFDIGLEDLLYSFGRSHPGQLVLHNYPQSLQRFHRPSDGIEQDVAATDILRCRELGVPRYCAFREALGMSVPKTFLELTGGDEGHAAELEEVYERVEDVDLLVGMFAEPPVRGFAFSDTAFRIFIVMAPRRLNSDRFFTKDFRSSVYTSYGMDLIKGSKMADVLARNLPDLWPVLNGMKNAFKPWKAPGGTFPD